MDNSGMVFDLLSIGIGIYMLYVWYQLKFKDVVNEKVLLSAAYPFRRCKDKEGYKAYISKRLVIVAAACFVAGGLGLVNGHTDILGIIPTFSTVIFLAVVIWFAAALNKAYKKFW